MYNDACKDEREGTVDSTSPLSAPPAIFQFTLLVQLSSGTMKYIASQGYTQ